MEYDKPFDEIPPIDSIIEYMTFNQFEKEGEGVLTTYVVKGIIFTTEESVNNTYRNKMCKVIVDKIESKGERVC